MSNSNSYIIDKMNNLLPAAESKINAGEAVLIARQLHVILSKHNIAELADEAVEQEGDIEHDRPWKRWLANSIARLCFCDFYSRRMEKRKSKYMFVGTEVNRAFAINIFKIVASALEREARAESREELGKYSYSFVTSVLNGASYTIVDRCERLIKSAQEGSIKDEEEGEMLPAMRSTYKRLTSQVESWMDKNLDIELEPTKRDEGKQVLSI